MIRLLVEAGAVDDLAADAVAHQAVLQHAAPGVGVGEDGNVVARTAAVDVALDPACDEVALGMLSSSSPDAGRSALPAVGPEALGLLVAVVGDEGVGRRRELFWVVQWLLEFFTVVAS